MRRGQARRLAGEDIVGRVATDVRHRAATSLRRLQRTVEEGTLRIRRAPLAGDDDKVRGNIQATRKFALSSPCAMTAPTSTDRVRQGTPTQSAREAQ
ncbi:hypothetical protein BIV25_43300 [Streptomyces sp. MUSC 14]|nr:hypothetical protein BIV25_43300 [Streptomyces sp. MUSC 14]